MAEGNGLLNRPVGINPLRGFESRPLRYWLLKTAPGGTTILLYGYLFLVKSLTAFNPEFTNPCVQIFECGAGIDVNAGWRKPQKNFDA